ncbi:HNH endonuclease signature motif containing protein [Clostridium thermarum]|uniref:HNH endonuclease signature motif containing protein n=1 Tax=Clostridium thermarum TaxID=1716543 RepID=UPI0013D09010|nr:HNH endonuclease signature motif containing protein [Clostridium thermarum]
MKSLHKSRLMAVILVFSLIITCLIIPVSASASINTSSPVSISTASEKAAIENSDNIIQAYKVSETPIENGTQFRIAIPISADSVQSDDTESLDPNATSDSVAASVYYIDVSIQGSGGKVVGKVWHLGFLPSHNLEVGLWAGNTSASSKITSVKTTNITAWPGSTQVSSTPTASKFWDVTITGTMDGSSFYYSTYDFLFNKKAVEYPTFTDCFGNVFMTVPSSAAWSKVSNPLPALTTAQRNAYITWYEQTYNNGNALNWNDVQIHHIKPRAYGGTHDYSNLMPLKTSDHTTITTWWANY